MNAPVSGGAEQVFARFLDLERQTRAARDAAQLAYSLVNDGQSLFGFRHAALLIAGKVQAVTGVSAVEPNAPFVAFVEQAVAQLFKQDVLKQARVIAPRTAQRIDPGRLAQPVRRASVLVAAG